MKATQQLHNLGQSLWLDNITRDLLNNGTLERYIAELAITGLTSNPTIFDHAIPINVTLLFSPEQYRAAAEAYIRGIERRIDAGLNPKVGSVASVFVSRWDTAVAGKVPPELANRLGIAIARRTYQDYVKLLGSSRWQRAFNEGAIPQRLLFASTGTKDPKASDTLYVENLAVPLTVNTMPEATLQALADHGKVDALPAKDMNDSARTLDDFVNAEVNLSALGAQLQEEGATSFVKSWNDLR